MRVMLVKLERPRNYFVLRKRKIRFLSPFYCGKKEKSLKKIKPASYFKRRKVLKLKNFRGSKRKKKI